MEARVHVNKTARLGLSSAFVATALLVAGLARADVKSECIAASEKAQSLRDDRKLLDAREQFLTCARDVCPVAIRKDCADQIADMVKRTPSVVLHAKDPAGQDLVAVQVTADGKLLTSQLDGRSISLDPGVHDFRFEAAGNEPVDQKIVLAEGEHDRAVTVRFGAGAAEGPRGAGAPSPQKKGAPIGAFVVGGVGLVSMAVAPVLWAMGLGQKSSDQSPTGCAPPSGPGCSASEIDSIKTKLVVGDVLMFGGAAIFATGVIWAIVHYASGHEEAANPPAALFDVAPATYGRGAVASTTIRW